MVWFGEPLEYKGLKHLTEYRVIWSLFQVWHLGIFFFSAEATALLWEPLLLFEELAGASSPTPEFNNFLIEKSDQETIRTFSIVSSDQFFSATGLSSPYVRHQLAGLRILYPVETSQDRLALLFHQSVDHRLYRPHWGVVRLLESVRYN